MRTYFFKNVGTIDAGEDIQTIIAITERAMNGLDPCLITTAESVQAAIWNFMERSAEPGILFRFVIDQNIR